MSHIRDERIADLEAEARLADLVIERTPIEDLPKLDVTKMTAGELITLANVLEAIRTIKAEYAYGEADYPSSSTAERRSSTHLGGLPDDAIIETVNGPIQSTEVPRAEDGRIDKEWLAANCTCDEHERKRIIADTDKRIGDDSIARGLYL